MSEVREWLDDVRPGYGDKFGPALDEYGVDFLSDLIELASLNELDDILEAAGAKKMHLLNIHKRIVSLTSSDPNSPPTVPGNPTSPIV